MQARRYRGPAIIEHGDGATADVQCDFEVVQHGAMKGWRGSYADADVADEPMGGAAELRLSNGRGKIIITNAFIGTGSGWFTGSGEPPSF